MKKLLVFVLIAVMLLSGCLPKEYTDGVRLDRDYPDRELPIYDDAIVYECEADDEEVTVYYGTEDDIDDVIDFYMDFFEDEGIAVEQEDDKDEYYAKGMIDDFEFEIEVEEPRGGNEEKAFKTIVKVEIENIDGDLTPPVETTPEPTAEPTATPKVTAESTPEVTAEPTQQPVVDTDWDNSMPLLQKLQGFWIAVAYNDEPYYDGDVAIEIFDNWMTSYAGSRQAIETVDIEVHDENTIYYFEDGEKYFLTVSFLNDNGTIYMTIDDGEIAASFILSSFDNFMNDATANNGGMHDNSGTNNVDYSDDEGYLDFYFPHNEWQSDENIARTLTEYVWIMTYYTPIDGIADYTYVQRYNADGTSEYSVSYTDDEGNSFSYDGTETWYVKDQVIYESGDDYTWSAKIEVGYDEDREMMKLFYVSISEDDYGAKYVFDEYTP